MSETGIDSLEAQRVDEVLLGLEVDAVLAEVDAVMEEGIQELEEYPLDPEQEARMQHNDKDPSIVDPWGEKPK